MAVHPPASGRSLSGQPWFEREETRQVIAALGTGGRAARFVGGCVRDALIGRPVRDVDIATPEEPEAVIALIEAAGMKAIPTGVAHGTVTAVAGRHHFEITTLRRDVATDGRRARVAFIDDWHADARRRDFTINALFADADGKIHDYVGGLKDLEAGRVAFIGDPYLRIDEDALRILRFFRFQAFYGGGEADIAGLRACRDKKAALRTLSAERVAGETLKLLSARNPAPTVRAMLENAILQEVLPEASAERLPKLERLAARERTLRANDPLRRLGCLLDASREGLEAVALRLRLSKAQRQRLVGMAAGRIGPIGPALNAEARRRILYRIGKERFADLAFLEWADAADESLERWTELFQEAEAWRRPRLPVRGRDAIAAGAAEGQEVGRLLKRLEGRWIESDFKASRDDLLEEMRRAVAEIRSRGGSGQREAG